MTSSAEGRQGDRTTVAPEHDTLPPTVPVASEATSDYDAVLLVSFGGPEAPDEVMPFLRRVTAGRGVPDERLEVVAEHYLRRGGVSPINELNRDIVTRLREALSEAGLDLPIYWGNRNSVPFLDDTVAEMTGDGIRRALALVTSAYGSYSGCRQYRENLATALAAVGDTAPAIDKARVYFNHPGFIEPFVDGLRGELSQRPTATTQVLFSAHSIPLSMAESSHYVAQIEAAIELILDGVGAAVGDRFQLVWQSRSGSPRMPWLEPDIVDTIAALDDEVTDVVVVPVGFVSDHMEVLEDLDTAAASAAEARGMAFGRVATPGTDPRFIAMLVDLIREQVESTVPVAIGRLGLEPDQCSASCCLPPTSAKRPV